MKSRHKKVLISVVPFLFLIGSFLVINVLSSVEANSLDQDWRTRKLILGLFMFASISFLPSLLQISFSSNFPFISMNLSHHDSQKRKLHELRFKNHSICTGCFGTSLSTIFGNVILIFYFFNDSDFFNYDLSIFFLFSGLILILFTYSRYFFMFSPFFRLFQHSTLFLGLASMIIASDLVYHSAFLMMFLLPSWLSFLYTRIQLSKIEHSL